jgi:hypothetical protein
MDHAVLVRAALAAASEYERAYLPQCSSAFLPGAHRQSTEQGRAFLDYYANG